MPRSALLVAVAVWALAVGLARASPIPTNHDTAPVTLDIEKYVSMTILNDLGMTVYSEYFGQDIQVSATSTIDVTTNFNTRVRCPDHVDLSDHRAYTPKASVKLEGHNPAVHNAGYWYLDLDPGVYNSGTQGRVSLGVTLEKTWQAAEDPAGHYSGTILVEAEERIPGPWPPYWH